MCNVCNSSNPCQPDDGALVVANGRTVVLVRFDMTMNDGVIVMRVRFVHMLGCQHRRDEHGECDQDPSRSTYSPKHSRIMFARRGTVKRHHVTTSFWCAYRGGQRESAASLLDRGPDIDWIGFDGLTADALDEMVRRNFALIERARRELREVTTPVALFSRAVGRFPRHHATAAVPRGSTSPIITISSADAWN